MVEEVPRALGALQVEFPSSTSRGEQTEPEDAEGALSSKECSRKPDVETLETVLRHDTSMDPLPKHPPDQGQSAGSKFARSLLLTRSSLPVAGAGVAACRRPRLPSAKSPPSTLIAGTIAGGRGLPKLTASPPEIRKGKPEAGVYERDRITELAVRLSQVEKTNQAQAAKLLSQRRELDALRAEVKMLRNFAETAEQLVGNEGEVSSAAGPCRPRHTDEEFKTLKAEREQLEHQVEEMTTFLRDYGLTWVGEESNDNGEDSDSTSRTDGANGADSPCVNGLSRKSSPSSCSPSRFDVIAMDVDTVTARVKALNEMVESRGARIVSNVVGGSVHARLVAEDSVPLPLTLFQDGVKLGHIPFQEYTSREAQLLLRDINDGFFPFALKEHYPGGVAMRVIDRTSLEHEVWFNDYAANDVDLSADGLRLLPSAGRVLCGSPKKGQLGEILGRANTGQRGVSIWLDPAVTAAKHHPEDVSLLQDDRDPSNPIARVQVKLDDGQRVVFSLEATQTVRDLHTAVAKWLDARGNAYARGFSLRSAFPPRAHADLEKSLQEAGLAPNATVHLGAQA